MIRVIALAALLVASSCTIDSEVTRTVGARCADQDECTERCLLGTDYPDGFCSISCDDDSDCPGSTSCVDREGGVCLFICEVEADCEFLGDTWSCQGDTARPGGEDVLVCRGG